MKLDGASKRGKDEAGTQGGSVPDPVRHPSTALELSNVRGPAIQDDAHWAAAFTVEDWKECLRTAAWEDRLHRKLYGHIWPDSRDRTSTAFEIGRVVERFPEPERRVYEQAMDALVRDAVNELPKDAITDVLKANMRPIYELLTTAQIVKSGPCSETLQSIALNRSIPLSLRLCAATTIGELSDAQECSPDFWTQFDYEKEPQFLNPCMFFFTQVKQPHVALAYFVACAEHALRAMRAEDDQFFEGTLIFCTSYAIEMVQLLDPQVSCKEFQGMLSQESRRVFDSAEASADAPHRRARILRRLG